MEVDIKKTITLLELIKELPALKPIHTNLNSLQVSVNREISSLDVTVSDGDEVAFLPPFSGG